MILREDHDLLTLWPALHLDKIIVRNYIITVVLTEADSLRWLEHIAYAITH
jgi:hypothetical protein